MVGESAYGWGEVGAGSTRCLSFGGDGSGRSGSGRSLTMRRPRSGTGGGTARGEPEREEESEDAGEVAVQPLLLVNLKLGGLEFLDRDRDRMAVGLCDCGVGGLSPSRAPASSTACKG